MKILSWNVNGFRAVLKKGFWDWFASTGADIVCLQETKAAPEQIPENEREHPDYHSFFLPSSLKKGYSGVAVYSRQAPRTIEYELPDARFQGEGRLIRLEYESLYLFNVYFPNGQMSEDRLLYKLDFYDAFLEQAQACREAKPVVVCGDFNTAHTEIDLKNPKANEKTSGFLPVERAWMDRFIAAGYLDTFRLFTREPGHYSWWSYRSGARQRNAGWRIDYFFVSSELRPRVREAWIEPQVEGSDHCPVGVQLDSDLVTSERAD